MKTCATIVAVLCLAARMSCGDVWQDLAKYKYGQGNAADEANALMQKTPVAQHGAIEDALIAVVAAKDATQDGKALACRMLQQIGTEKCIPAVAPLLNDELLSHYARLVLERMESAKADAAMRSALATVPDKLKIGIMGSLGARRDIKAVEQVAKLAMHNDPAVAAAALGALGRIGGNAAAQCLLALKPVESLKAVHVNAVLDCARSLKGADAAALYDVALAGTTVQRLAALSGLLAADEKKAVALMVACIRGDDAPMSAGVLTLVCNVKSELLTKAMTETLGTLPDEKKAALVTALGARGDNAALGCIVACVASSNNVVREAVLGAVSKIGDEGSVTLLLGMGGDATKVIAAMSHSGVDATLVKALDDTKLRSAATRALIARSYTAAVPKFFALLGDSDIEVRKSAWEGLGALATEASIVQMAKTAFATKDQGELGVAVGAARNVCAYAGDKATCFAVMAPYYDGAPDAGKVVIIDLASQVGNPAAMAVVKKAMQSGNKELYRNAVRSLAAWCNESAVAELLGVARSASEETDRILALRGYVRIAGTDGTSLNINQRAEMFKTAAELATRADEKKLIINSIRGVRTADTLNLVSGYMDDPALREEAEQSAMDMAWNLHKDGPVAVVKVVANKLLTSKNQEIADRAKQMLAEMGK